MAGAASAASGFFSFVIAGAASWLFYQEYYAKESQAAPINPKPDPSPTNDADEIGYWHNQLCSTFDKEGYTNVTFNDVITVASEIRPDLAKEIHEIPESDFQNALDLVLDKNFNDNHVVQQQVVEEYFGLSGNDLVSFNTIVDSINASQTDDEFYSLFDKLNKEIPRYSITEEDKTRFINSLGILNYSYFLWWVG